MDTPVYTRRNPAPPPKRKSKITIPERVCPAVKLLFSEMKRQVINYNDLEEGSGVKRAAIKAWRHKNYPNLNSIEAALGFVGWDFLPVARAEVISPEVRSALAPAVEAMGLTMGESLRLLTVIAAGAPRPEAEQPMAKEPATP